MIGVYYFYRKLDKRKKIDLNELLSNRNDLNRFMNEEYLDDANEKLEFKIPNTMDEVLDKYNTLKELKKLKLKVYDICYFAINLDQGEEKVNEELDKLKKSKGFVKFLTKEDVEFEKRKGEL